jgi:hypothetical protein
MGAALLERPIERLEVGPLALMASSADQQQGGNAQKVGDEVLDRPATLEVGADAA